jgi:hypothetical protein
MEGIDRPCWSRRLLLQVAVGERASGDLLAIVWSGDLVHIFHNCSRVHSV